MNTHLEITSSIFPPYESEEEIINPGCWGKRLAEYLNQKLQDNGYQTEEINPEDWGWVLPIKNDAFPLWIGCGHQYGDDNEFLCFIEPSKSPIRRIFKKVETHEVINSLTTILEQIFTSDPDIESFRWWDESEKV